ncbi:sigma-70 family RNA polymerase sigma factor [Neisseria sp. 23W00296]|uniref:sigma-70 family RNA polymerase sigma factor n=1 Tax=unclassified Neisseria TaxID=2623750 RepID=UPI003757A478
MTRTDPQNFGGELAAMRPDILRFATVQLRDKTLAEDLVQETLAAAWDKQSQFGGKSGLKTWVMAILKNKITDHFRSSRTTLSLDSLQEENEAIDQAYRACFDADGHWLESASPAAWHEPESSIEQQDFFRILEHCMDGLPADTARIFYLREVMGMDVDEICREFAISKDNCYVILHRARNGLRRCLQMRWFDLPA